MNEIRLFNLNDLTVLLCGFLALLLAGLLASRGRELKNLFLAAFFLQCFLYAVDTLVYWNLSINAALSSLSANFFFLFGFTLLLQGPLLYGFTKASVYRDFSLRWRHGLHLLPALLYPVYMAAIYYRHDETYKLAFVHDWSAVIRNPWFDGVIWAQRLSVFGYSLLCVNKLYEYIRYLRNTDVPSGKVDIQWLKLLLIGFLTVNSWLLLGLLESRLLKLGLASPMGIAESYIRFALMSLLVVYLLRNSHGFTDISKELTIADSPTEPAPYTDVLNRLVTFMENEKPYREPNITLERLAARLNVSPKLLSATINRKLHKNFFEMIRHYRVEEAKVRLTDVSESNHSIGDVMKACGFNSKSVFNQAFKQAVGVTPSRYRQQHLSG